MIYPAGAPTKQYVYGFQVMLVFIGVAAVIVYRVVMFVDYCDSTSAVNCLIVSTICSSLLNATLILLLGQLYEKIAVILTNWGRR